MKSPKTHRNKAYHLIGVYSWLRTFKELVPFSADMSACAEHLRRFANDAKHRSRYILTTCFDEHSMINRGHFFAPQEYLVFMQWLLREFNTLVDDIAEAKDQAAETNTIFAVTRNQGWRMQRLLLVIVFSFSGGYRREVVGRLRRDLIRINSDKVLLSDMTREKAERSKTTEIPLPAFIQDFLEVFLQYGRPALLCRENPKTGETFDPLSLWVGGTGEAMQLNYVTSEVRRLGQEFNPYLDVTPYTSRRTAATNVFAERIPLEGAKLEDFTRALSLLMNVTPTVLEERYNRHKALNKNAETQRIMYTPTKQHVQPELDQVQSSISRLLEGKTVIPVVESSKITRPVRLNLEEDEWLKEKKKQEKELKIKQPKYSKVFYPKLKKATPTRKRKAITKATSTKKQKTKQNAEYTTEELEEEEEEIDPLLFD